MTDAPTAAPPAPRPYSPGLEGVVAGETSLGYVDGEHHANIDLNAAHVNRLQIFGISNVRLKREERAETTRGFARDILPALADGRITPLIDRVFGFDELPAAMAHMDAGDRVGKVVVRII